MSRVFRGTVVVNEKFPFRLRCTPTKRSVPVHGTSTHRDRFRARMRFVLLPFIVKISFRNRLYGKTLTFASVWHRLSRTMDKIKRREAAEVHIASVSSLKRGAVDWTPAEVLSSFLAVPFKHSKMSLREITALIDSSRQETSGKLHVSYAVDSKAFHMV